MSFPVFFELDDAGSKFQRWIDHQSGRCSYGCSHCFDEAWRSRECRPSSHPSPCEALVVRLPDGTYQYLGHRGGGLIWFIEGYSFHDAFEGNEPPEAPGIYCFTGHYWSRTDYWGEWDCGIEGVWRVATAEDCCLTTDDDPPTGADTTGDTPKL